MRYRLVVQYEGTAYAGWQVQPRARTVQGEFERALATLTGQAVRVLAAGRTDAGVHAAGQVISFALDRAWEPGVLVRALNALTPEDISVLAADVVPEDFHPRRWAISRLYTYRIWNHRVLSPFWRRYAWHVVPALDVEAMQAAAAKVCGEHDFSAFRAAGCEARHPVRCVLRSSLLREGEILVYSIEANGFLRHMVRNLVGTLVEVGLGKRAPEEVDELLAARKRTLAGPTAPAHGLCLSAVRYPDPLAKP
ncbi:MAG: tRNA pseudouridine(38-40) synthase TruA [Candidatus Binatia bacterium]|nr:tRNA pseudouridine(38-40) synthase TruA [Candidatus Binatia bacterium]